MKTPQGREILEKALLEQEKIKKIAKAFPKKIKINK